MRYDLNAVNIKSRPAAIYFQKHLERPQRPWLDSRKRLVDNALQAFGTFPTLLDGETRMTESAAVIQYLAARRVQAQAAGEQGVDSSQVGDLLTR